MHRTPDSKLVLAITEARPRAVAFGYARLKPKPKRLTNKIDILDRPAIWFVIVRLVLMLVHSAHK